MNNKDFPDKVHLINSEILPILEQFPLGFSENVQTSFMELKNALHSYDIDYNDLRSVLNPSAEIWAFVFDADSLANRINGNYVDFLITKAVSGLERKSRCIFLAGDLAVNRHNYQRYQELLKRNGADESLVLKTTLCAIVVINISSSCGETIEKVFADEKSFLFASNITKPDLDKFALTYCLVQKTIKLGNKLLYMVSEPDDGCNYSGVVFHNHEFILCPILDYYYLIFLLARPLQIAAPFSELKYSIKTFFDIEVTEYPEIVIPEEKLEYLKKNKNILLPLNKIETAINEAFHANQPFHISYTGYGEGASLNMNFIVFIDERKYTFALKWDLKSNIAKLVTAIPR